MRGFILFILCLFCSNIIFGQTDDLKGCKNMSSVFADSIASLLLLNNYKPSETYDGIIHKWKKECGTTEPILRIEILSHIQKGESADSLIKLYYENYYQFIFINRIKDAGRLNYRILYNTNEGYFSFVPLRSNLDSVTYKIANTLLERDDLNRDERINCLLFSGNIEEFNFQVGKQENYNTSTSKSLRKTLGNYATRPPYFTIVTGIWQPMGEKNTTFSLSPKIGVHFGSPLSKRIRFDLGVNFRIMANDSDYEYKVDQDTLNANSATAIFFGVNMYYSIFKYKEFEILPNIGFGLESIGTGIEKKENADGDGDNFHRVSTFHFKAGLNFSHRIFKHDKILLGVIYHYCPYEVSKGLITEFSNHALSCEVQYRF